MQKIDIDQLVGTAAEVFAHHGFDGVGMREVSRECGVSLPTLYYYFGSKEKLFETACCDRYQKALDQVRAGLDFSAPLSIQIDVLGGRLFDLLTTDQTLFLLLRRDLIQGSQSRGAFHARLQHDGMMKILEQLLTRRVAEAQIARLAFTAAALIFGYCEFVMVAGGDAALFQRRRSELIEALKTLLK